MSPSGEECPWSSHSRRRFRRHELDFSLVHDRSSRFRKEAALLISGPVAGLTTRHAKGRGIGGRAASKPAEDGVRLPAPLRVRRADLHEWLGSSRLNSTLTTEEIASNGIDDRALPPRGRIRSPSAGRRRGTAPGRNPGAFGTAGSTPAPRTHGPNAPVAVHLPCKEYEDGSSPSGSTARAGRPSTTGVAGRRLRRTWRIWETHRRQKPADLVHESSILSVRTLAGVRPPPMTSTHWCRTPPLGIYPVAGAQPPPLV